MKLLRPVGYLSLLVLLSASSAAQDASKSPDPATWAPADALGFVGIADVERLERDFRKTGAGRMLADEKARSSGETRVLLTFAEQIRKRIAAALDIEPERVRNPFQGAIGVFLTPPSSGEMHPRAIFVAGVGDQALTRDYYERAVRRLRQQASAHEAVSFGSATIDTFVTASAGDGPGTPDSSAADGGDSEPNLPSDALSMDEDQLETMFGALLDQVFSARALPERLALCLTSDRLIISTEADEVKSVLRREKSGENLAGTDEYKSIERALGPIGDIRFLLHVGRLFDALLANPKLTDQARQNVRQGREIIGGKGVRAVIGHVHMDDKLQYESRFDALVLIDGERSGMAKLLSLKPHPTAPPARVAAESMFCISSNIDPPELLREIEALVRRNDAAAGEAMQRELESVELPGGERVNLRKELFENLRGPLAFSLGFRRPYDAECARVLLSLGHRNRAALLRLLEAIRSAAPLPITDRDFGGAPVYDLSFGLTLALTDEALFVGDTKAVEAALKPGAESESLASEAAFAALAKLAPSDCGAMLYVDQRRISAVVIELVQHEAALMGAAMTNPSALMAQQMAMGMTGAVDKENVDAARHMSQYFGASIFTLRSVPEGLRMTQYTSLAR